MRGVLLTGAAVLSLALVATVQAGPKAGSGGHGPGSHGPTGHGPGFHGPSGHGPGMAGPNRVNGAGRLGGSDRASGSFKDGSRKGNGPKAGVKSFKGRSGHRWGRKCFDRRYGCKVFFCANDGCWYYWCAPDGCYYTVDYCPYGTYSWDDNGDDGEG
jgi:hypothetical protein